MPRRIILKTYLVYPYSSLIDFSGKYVKNDVEPFSTMSSSSTLINDQSVHYNHANLDTETSIIDRLLTICMVSYNSISTLSHCEAVYLRQ